MFSSPENSVPGSKDPLGPAFTDRHEQLQQQHQQKQQGLLLLLAERILLAPVELEFNGPSLPAANVVGDPNVAPTADMFENDAELVCDGFGKD